MSNNLKAEVGLRGSYLSKTKSFLPSASLNLKYNITSNITLGFNYGRYYQYLYTRKEIRTEDLFSPYSIYFLSSNKNDISNTDQFSFSIENHSPLNFKAEAYYKIRNNLHSSYNEPPRYVNENGYAAGIDVLLKKTTGDLTGWIGYSFSRSIKFGRDYDYYNSYDRTHNFKILLSYQLWKNWKVSAYWTIATGAPYTDVIGRYLGGEDYRDSPYGFDSYGAPLEDGRFFFRPIDDIKDSKRLPLQHRLDIGINGSLFWGKYMLKPYLQILNIYNSPNPFYYKIEVSYDRESKEFYWGLFIVPTLGVTVEF